tara:strand:- start:132 stop:1652 length:1521 start_codon:yes stop_codon:yes gene_type:complete
MIQQRLGTKIFVIVPILLFFSAFAIFSYNLDQMPWIGDEVVYFYPAYVNYFELILQGDLFNECWKNKIFCEDPDRSSGLRIGKLSSQEAWQSLPAIVPILLTGTSFNLFGDNDDPAFSYENLTAARAVSPVLGALIVVFVFYIGKLLFNRFVGISFALLVLFHGLIIFNSRMIMLEIFAHFLLIFSFLLFVKAISDGKINLKILLFSALLCSLGLITKFYEVVALVPIVIILIILRNDFRKKIDKHLIRNRFFTNSLPISLLFCVVVVGVFFIVQPFFWDQPIEQVNWLMEGVDNYHSFHLPFSPEVQIHHNIGAIFSATIAPIADLYCYNFNDDCPNFGGPGNTVISNFSTVPLTILFIIGIGFLAVDLRKKNFEFSKLILVSWYFLTFLMLALTLDSYQYDRYWIGLFFPMMFIASYGTYRLTKNLNKFTTFTFVAVSILTHALSVFIFWEILYAGPTSELQPPFPISLQESITIPLIYSFNIIFCIFTGGLIIKNLKKLSISN